MSSGTRMVPQTSRLDVNWVREQFPALKQTVNDQPAVFFDAPGGTQVPQRVIDAISHYLATSNSNTHGAFLTSERTDKVIADAHAAMADFLNCDADEVVFGPNMTTLTLALSRAIGRELKSGDELLVTVLDHDANVSPWVSLEERGVKVRTADIKPSDCTLDMFDLQAKIRRSTRVVAVGWAANAVGTINPVDEIVRLAHAAGSMAFIDAVHYAPHGLVDVRALDCDFLACSAYKFFGPHLGVLYGKREQLERLRPYKLRACSEQLPDRWETGTQNHEALAGLIAAIDYLATWAAITSPKLRPAVRRSLPATKSSASTNMGWRRNSSPAWWQFRALRSTESRISPSWTSARRLLLSVWKATHRASSRPSWASAEYSPGDGNYYAINLTERLGVEKEGGMLRIGLAHYHTAEEVERLLEELKQLASSN